jgi:hypothetical protein
MYLLLKGKLLDSLPPSARKGAEARNMMAASGKLQVRAASPGTARLLTRHTSHVTRHTSHVTRHTSHVTRHTSHATGQPRSADTWSALGHSLWEAGDVKDAYAVFSYALDSQQVRPRPCSVSARAPPTPLPLLCFSSCPPHPPTSRISAGVGTPCREHGHAVQVTRHVTCGRIHRPGPFM